MLWRRLTLLASVILLAPASLLAVHAAAPFPSALGVPVRTAQGVSSFNAYLPLVVRFVPSLRIDAAASAGHTDASGRVWLADTGFVDGTAGNYGNISISNTDDPLLY
jgi:hypothetical protein